MNRVEFDPMRANVGLTAPPPPDTNGGDGDIGSNHNGGQADSRFSNMANPAAGCYEVGGVVLPCTWSSFDVMWAFVWGPARNPVVSMPSDSPRVWVPGQRRSPIVLPPNPFAQFLDVERVERRETPGHWIYAPAPFLHINFMQQPRLGRVGSEDLKAYKARIAQMLNNKTCWDFIQELLNEVKAQTDTPSNDILTTFDSMRFYWAKLPAWQGGEAYWEDMGTVRAASINNTINTERIGGSLANQQDRRAFLIAQTTGSFLGETMHHLAQGSRMFGDGVMANALNAILVRQGRDTHQKFAERTQQEVENASRYWHPKMQSACPGPKE